MRVADGLGGVGSSSHCRCRRRRRRSSALVASAAVRDDDVDAVRRLDVDGRRHRRRGPRRALSRARRRLRLHLLHAYQPARRPHRRRPRPQAPVSTDRRRRLGRHLHSPLPLQEVLTALRATPDRPTDRRRSTPAASKQGATNDRPYVIITMHAAFVLMGRVWYTCVSPRTGVKLHNFVHC